MQGPFLLRLGLLILMRVAGNMILITPDRLGTSGGSVSAMTYVGGTGDTAGVVYDGTFKVVNLGFPL